MPDKDAELNGSEVEPKPSKEPKKKKDSVPETVSAESATDGSVDSDAPKESKAESGSADVPVKTDLDSVPEVKDESAASEDASDAPEAEIKVAAKPRVRKSDDSVSDVDKPRARRFAGLSQGVKSVSAKQMIIRVSSVVVALVAVVVVVFGVLIYAYKSQSPAVRVVSSIVPYPVERVNGRFVSYSDYLFEVDANQKAYQNNAKLNNQPAPDFKSTEGKKLLVQIKQHAIDKLKSDAVVAQLASDKKVKVTEKEVNDLMGQLYERYGGKDTLLKTLSQIYGWDVNDLKRVITKQLLAKNLEDKVTADPAVDAAAKKKAQEVLAKVKAGGDFAALAKQYSQASDAASGGDLGFFTKGQLPDNVQSAAEALQPDQVSDVIKTQYGYEIMKVVEKKDDGSIRGLHILIKTIDFNEYFQQELKKAKSTTYIKV